MNKTISACLLLIAISLVYYFVVRPIQKDRKLEECLYGAGISLEDGDTYQRYEQVCIQKYGR